MKNLLFFALFFILTTQAQPKLDLEQNKRISELEQSRNKINSNKGNQARGKNYDNEINKLNRSIFQLKKQIAELQKNKSAQATTTQTINQNEVKKLDMEIAKQKNQLNALKRAVRAGLDQSLVKVQVDNIEKTITSLKSKKFTILNTKISNQEPSDRPVSKKLSFEGLVEFDIVQSKTVSQVTSSQIDLATLELATEIKVSDYVKGNILIEKQDAPATLFDVTEAFVEYGNMEEQIVNFRVGKMVIPFGKYETSFFLIL
jgi:DNA repair exonuclease SbcCD ATPase subunit